MKKLIITGGCGFIGTNACIKFIEAGYEVIAMDNLERKDVYKNLEYLQKTYKDKFKFIWGDVRNPIDIAKLPTDILGVIHAAANPGIPRSLEQPLYDFEVNAKGTLNMLNFVKDIKCPFIYTSTNKVYSDAINQVALIEGEMRFDIASVFDQIFIEGASDKGFSEVFPIDGAGEFPHSPYGCSKYTGDIYCQEFWHAYEVPTIINRQSCIGGKFQFGVSEQGWISWFCQAKLFDKPLEIFGNGKQVRDILDGEDLASLFLYELENSDIFRGKVFNVGGGLENSISLLETIKYLDEKYADEYDNFKYEFKDWRLADHKLYISDTTKIKKMGWKPQINAFQCIDRICEHIEHNLNMYNV